jgi:hypothetical protein
VVNAALASGYQLGAAKSLHGLALVHSIEAAQSVSSPGEPPAARPWWGEVGYGQGVGL